MSPRPQPPTPASHADPDLESTAELTPLDAAALGLVMEEEPARASEMQPLVAAAPRPGSAPPTPAAPAAAHASAAAPARESAAAAALAQVERDRDAARAALELAERRLAATAEEMSQARALVSASSERVLELQRRLEQHENAQRAAPHGEQHARTAAAVAPAVDAALAEMHAQRSRAASYLEALQSAEGRRLIAEGLIGDLDRAAAVRDDDLARLRRELAGRDDAASERDAELERRAARGARLEQQLNSLNAALGAREALLRDARQATEGLQVSVTRLQAEIAAGAERIRALEALAAQFRDTEAQQRRELEQLAAERAQLNAQLESALATASAAAAAAARPDAAGSAAPPSLERLTELEAALVAKHQRIAQLESELTRLRAEMSEWGGVLRTAHDERDQNLAGVTAAEARAHALQRDLSERGEAIRLLQSQSDAHAARARELEADLAAAEDTVQRLESELHMRGQRIEELEKSNRQWRATVDEARLGSTDPRLRRVRPPAGVAASEAVSESATCLLIQSRRGRETTHVLARKTSIGRTPDNDLQIDAKVVSRHHAVILVGASDAIIEDLNSTNGVLVNGQRVTRHTLRDGDQLVIGRERYRFAVRKADKR